MVECDDAIHRIARLTLPKGFHIHVASQWWTLPRHVIEWFISDPLPIGFMDYAQHYIVADENYFATMILNSPYCGDVVQKNHVMVMFDKWENDLKTGKSGRKDRRKCLHPYPDHCGRSPTTLTMQDVDIVRSSKMLFARKFDVSNNSSLELVNYMDEWRARSEQHQLLMPERDPNDESSFFMLRLRTNKTVAAVNNAFLKENGNRKLTATDNLPGEDDLCMAHRGGLADRVTLEKCDSNSTLQYFTLDGCEGNSFVTLRDGQSPVLVPHPGVDTATARPRIICQFIMVANQLCLDINGQNYNPGADMIGWECSGQWNQLFEITPDGMMLAHLPPTLRRIRDVKAGSFEKLCMQGEIADGAGGESAVKLQECIEYQYNASMNMINVKANPVLPGSKSNLQFDSILRTGRMMTYYLPKTKPKDAQQLKQSGRSEL